MPAPFVHRLRVRYGECDAQGIVFNANWFAYFDVALTELWREAFGSYDAMVQAGSDVVVVDASAQFKGSARFDEELDIAMGIERLGTTSMVSRLAATRDGERLSDRFSGARGSRSRTGSPPPTRSAGCRGRGCRRRP